MSTCNGHCTCTKPSQKDLTNRQKKVIPVILAAPSLEEGCKQAGIGRETFHRWMRTTTFKEEYLRQQNEVFAVALRSLHGHVEGAITKLTGLLSTANEPLLRQVCRDILEYSLKLREMVDLEERLTKIETAVLNK